jgi:hypothetical protein
MKRIVGTDVGSYVFTPGAAGVGTIILYGLPALGLEQLVLATDVTTGAIIFNFADPAHGATMAGNVVTLAADTSALSSADRLAIIVDLPESDTLRALTECLNLLGSILNPDALGRLRVAVESTATIGTVTTVTTVGTVTTMTRLGAVTSPTDKIPFDMSDTAFSTAMRANIGTT